MDVTKGNVKLTVGLYNKPGNVAVCMCIRFKGVSSYCLNMLKCGHLTMQAFYAGIEQAAMMYSLFEAVRAKLMGSVKELGSSKVTNVCCNTVDNHMVITWCCKNDLTTLKRTCVAAAQMLQPTKMYPRYKNNMQFLTGSVPNKDVFLYIANELASSINQQIWITAVGKLNMKDEKAFKEKLRLAAEAIANKAIAEVSSSKGEQPSKYDEAHYIHSTISCSGLAAAVTAEYIRNKLGVHVFVDNDGVCIPVADNKLDTKLKAIRTPKAISDYTHSKYSKLESVGLSGPMAYHTIASCTVTAETAKKVLSDKLTASSIESMLKSSLK